VVAGAQAMKFVPSKKRAGTKDFDFLLNVVALRQGATSARTDF